MVEGVIETGVDKLVSLVNKKKKISISQASKELGVGASVVEEWADFLEEEGIISLEYKLATTYLVERKLNKKEVESKAKEFIGKKDAFVRKVETSLNHLENETSGFDDIKNHFARLKTDLSGELGHVKEELKELENYERLKKEIDKQMIDQEEQFKTRMSNMDKQILEEKQKYQTIVDDVTSEKVKLERERTQALDLESQETDIKKKLDQFVNSLENLKNKVKMEDEMITASEKHIDSFKNVADKIKKDIDSKRDDIKSLMVEQKNAQNKIMKLQQDVMKKVMEKRKHIEADVAHGERMSEQFEKFFKKRTKAENMLAKVDKDRLELQKEMEKLINKARAFDLASKSSSVKGHIKELQKSFKELESKKSFFEKELYKVSSLLRG